MRALLGESRSVTSAGEANIEKQTKVWMIYGTEDGFTSVKTYRALGRELKDAGLNVREVEAGGHFFTTKGEGERLEQAFREWLEAV